MSDDVERIQREVASVKMALAEGVAVEEIDRYTTEQVETLLKKLPRTKFMAAQDMVNKLIFFKDAKRNLKKVQAQQMMIANANPELKAAPDRKAAADNSDEVEMAEIRLIEAEAQLRIAEGLHEAHDDLFTAVKKIAAIKISQEEDARNAQRFDRPN
jgi:hypothetical protein